MQQHLAEFQCFNKLEFFNRIDTKLPFDFLRSERLKIFMNVSEPQKKEAHQLDQND